MKQIFYTLCLTAVSHIIVLGQEVATLTLEEAVKLGLENNVTLRQAENVLKAEYAGTVSNVANMLPRVSLSGNVGRNDGNSFNQQEGRVVNGKLDFVNGSLDVSMPLFQGLNQVYSLKQSTARVGSQMHLIKRTRQDVIRDVANQYLQCLLDREFLAINKQNLDVQTKQFEQISAQVEAGSLAKVAQVNQEYQLKNAEVLVLRSQISLRNNKALLSQLLMLDPSAEFILADPQAGVNSGLENANYGLEELYSIASTNRSDLLQSERLEAASRFQLRANRGTYYPRVGAFFSYGSAYNQIQGTPDSVARDFDQQFFTDNVYKTYGLSVSVPIFTGLNNRSQVVRSKVNYDNARLNTEQLTLTVKSEVLRAYNNYKDAALSYEASQAQLDAARLAHELESERIRLGVSDILAYTLANTNLLNAKATFAQSKYTLVFQDVMLQYAIGTLKVEDIP